MKRLLALCAAAAALLLAAAPLQAAPENNGRYRVVAGVIDAPADRAPQPQNRPVIILVDSWTGRSWRLTETFRWRPLAFDQADVEQTLSAGLPPPLGVR